MSSRDPVIRIFDLGPTSRGVRMLPAGSATAVFGRGGGMRGRAARARIIFFNKLILHFYFILKPHPTMITLYFTASSRYTTEVFYCYNLRGQKPVLGQI